MEKDTAEVFVSLWPGVGAGCLPPCTFSKLLLPEAGRSGSCQTLQRENSQAVLRSVLAELIVR